MKSKKIPILCVALFLFSCGPFDNSDGSSYSSGYSFDWVTQIGYETGLLFGLDTSNTEICSNITMDASNNIYCSGVTSYSYAESTINTNFDITLTKINSDGELVWLTQLGEVSGVEKGLDTSTSQSCHALTVDANDNIYCGGSTAGTFKEASQSGYQWVGYQDAIIVKFNNLGKVEWVVQTGAVTSPTANGFERCRGITVDDVGNVYCAGSADTYLGEASVTNLGDLVVIKVNPSGEILWIKQLGVSTNALPEYDTSGYESLYDITYAKDGFLYATGVTGGSLADAKLGILNSTDVVIAKFDTDGNLIWIKQIGENSKLPGMDTSEFDSVTNIAVDSKSNIYVVGDTYGNFADQNGGNDNSDIFTAKFNKDGNLMWVKQLGASFSGPKKHWETGEEFVADTSMEDWSGGLTIDDSEDIFVAGMTEGSLGEENAGGSDIFIWKLNPNGDTKWIRQLGKSGQGRNNLTDMSDWDFIEGIALDTEGNIYGAGDTYSSATETNVNFGSREDQLFFKMNAK